MPANIPTPADGAKGQSLPKRTWPGFANANNGCLDEVLFHHTQSSVGGPRGKVPAAGLMDPDTTKPLHIGRRQDVVVDVDAAVIHALLPLEEGRRRGTATSGSYDTTR
jgi:hypothetical protein